MRIDSYYLQPRKNGHRLIVSPRYRHKSRCTPVGDSHTLGRPMILCFYRILCAVEAPTECTCGFLEIATDPSVQIRSDFGIVAFSEHRPALF